MKKIHSVILASLWKWFLWINKILTKVINFILLSIVYFVGIGITSLVGKFLKQKFLIRKLDKELATYWETLDLKAEPIERYYRQF